MDFNLARVLYLRIIFGSSYSSESLRRVSSLVDGWPLGVFFRTGSLSFSYKTSNSCFGESKLNSVPEILYACAVKSEIFSDNYFECSLSLSLSILAPFCSTLDKTWTKGYSNSCKSFIWLGLSLSNSSNLLNNLSVMSASSAA